MSKKYYLGLVLLLSVLISSNIATAETSIQQIQSPIYKDDIGRAHFLGRGGYSTIRKLEMQEAQANVVNETMNELSNKEQKVSETVKEAVDETSKSINNIETDITKGIQEKNEVPVSTGAKASFSSESKQMDPSAPFGKGAVYLPSSGVNESKTIYTDELGRLHFFGKANQFKD